MATGAADSAAWGAPVTGAAWGRACDGCGMGRACDGCGMGRACDGCGMGGRLCRVRHGGAPVTGAALRAAGKWRRSKDGGAVRREAR
jgi:hypothetical protein